MFTQEQLEEFRKQYRSCLIIQMNVPILKTYIHSACGMYCIYPDMQYDLKNRAVVPGVLCDPRFVGTAEYAEAYSIAVNAINHAKEYWKHHKL